MGDLDDIGISTTRESATDAAIEQPVVGNTRSRLELAVASARVPNRAQAAIAGVLSLTLVSASVSCFVDHGPNSNPNSNITTAAGTDAPSNGTENSGTTGPETEGSFDPSTSGSSTGVDGTSGAPTEDHEPQSCEFLDTECIGAGPNGEDEVCQYNKEAEEMLCTPFTECSENDLSPCLEEDLAYCAIDENEAEGHCTNDACAGDNHSLQACCVQTLQNPAHPNCTNPPEPGECNVSECVYCLQGLSNCSDVAGSLGDQACMDSSKEAINDCVDDYCTEEGVTPCAEPCGVTPQPCEN